MSEPTRYTRCWHCGREFPLREIRAHGAACQQPSFPRIERRSPFKAEMLNDTFMLTVDASLIQNQMVQALREADDKIAEPILVEWLRSRGYSIERADRLAEATALLAEFVDDDPCQLDHHGGCQTHGFLEPEPGERCHVERAREFIGGDES